MAVTDGGHVPEFFMLGSLDGPFMVESADPVVESSHPFSPVTVSTGSVVGNTCKEGFVNPSTNPFPSFFSSMSSGSGGPQGLFESALDYNRGQGGGRFNSAIGRYLKSGDAVPLAPYVVEVVPLFFGEVLDEVEYTAVVTNLLGKNSHVMVPTCPGLLKA